LILNAQDFPLSLSNGLGLKSTMIVIILPSQDKKSDKEAIGHGTNLIKLMYEMRPTSQGEGNSYS